MEKYVSMANTFNELVDCRMLQFELDFFLLSQSQLLELAKFFVHQCDALLGEDFFCQWEWNGRKVKLNSVFDRIQNKNTNFDFSCTADVLSNVVNDRNSFRVYDNMLVSPRIGETRLDTAISYDYPDALYKHLQKVHSLEECKEAIFQIFLEPNKKQIALWRWHDASVFFVSHRYTEYRNLYRGSFNFSIAFSCLKNANDLSEKLIGMAIQASAITSNINARIALSPISSPAPCSAHMMYFGGKVEGDGSHSASGFRSQEWYPYYYFQGAEWFNLLSPSVSSRIPRLVSEAQQYSQIVSTV